MANEIEGLLVDPIDGARPGVLRIDGDRIVAVEDRDVDGPLIFPGFVDLQIYDVARCHEHGVTGYLATVGTSPSGAVERFLADLPDDPSCLGAHLEGPYLSPEAVGAQDPDHVRPIDLSELEGWLATGQVRMLTLAAELDHAFDAIEQVVAAGAVAAIGHTATNHRTTRTAVDVGARFATHIWNAMGPIRSRAPGPVGALLEDDRVTLGLIADGRHLHPATEELTFRAAGPERIALTSDLVPPPQERPDGRLLGGDRCGAALVKRTAPRFGHAAAAQMASLTPATLLGLSDRGRLAPGFRADLAVLDAGFEPRATIRGGREIWARDPLGSG